MILERLRPVRVGRLGWLGGLDPDRDSDRLTGPPVAWVAGRRVEAARDALRTRGWAVLRGLPFVDGGRVDEAAVLAISTAFGAPSSRDGGVPIRRVTPAPLGDGTTFSSRAGAAGLHTDAQYHRVPESLVCMFMVRPAASGGLTRLLTVRDAMAAVERRADGGRLISLLTQPVWRWRVPAEFAVDRNRPQYSATAAVLGPGGTTIRWRGDNLAPELPAMYRAAAQSVDRCFDSAPGMITVGLDAGDLVVVDNRRVLHGRTWFADSDRLLLRVRLWDSP